MTSEARLVELTWNSEVVMAAPQMLSSSILGIRYLPRKAAAADCVERGLPFVSDRPPCGATRGDLEEPLLSRIYAEAF